MINGVILQKLQTLDDVLIELRSLGTVSVAQLQAEWRTRRVTLGILSDAAAYKKMVQFRNFIVHRYERVDDAILVDMVNRRLTDFDRFREEVLIYASQQNSDDN